MKVYSSIAVSDKRIVVLQNCMEFLKSAPGEDSETCLKSQTIDIKVEDAASIQDEEHPVLITSPVIKAEQEVCLCKHTTVIVSVTGWCRAKRSKHCGHFLIYCASPSDSRTSDSPTIALWLHQRHLEVKKEGYAVRGVNHVSHGSFALSVYSALRLSANFKLAACQLAYASVLNLISFC
jgi:hypothetical protein